MTPEDIFVCLCARQEITPAAQQRLLQITQQNNVEWETVFLIADQQHIAPFVYVTLSKMPEMLALIPADILDKFKKAQIHNILVKKRMTNVVEQLLKLLNQHSIEALLVKGAALNLMVYNQPWYTVSYDVDLVIKAREKDLPAKARTEIVGFMERFNHSAGQFREHLEYDYYDHHDVTMNNTLPIDFERIWAEAIAARVGSQKVLVMTPEDMFMAATIQSCRKRFYKLKALVDIVAIIDRYPNLDWDKVICRARECKCNSIVYTALFVVESLFDVPIAPQIYADLKVYPARSRIIKRLVNYLHTNHSFSELFARSDSTLFGRDFSWPLLLTYATYRVDYLLPKFGEIYGAWRNPPPPVPTAQHGLRH